MPEYRYQADWLFPVDQPPIRRGVLVVCDGGIVAIEPDQGQKVDRYFPAAAILPGLVNTHVHLDLTSLRGRCPYQGSFTQWLKQVIAHRRTQTDADLRLSVRQGALECVQTGTTLIGDIRGSAYDEGPIAGAMPRMVCFHEMIGLRSDQVHGVQARAKAWINETRSDHRFRKGLSPHSPYSVHRELMAWAGNQKLPLTIHLAEQMAERQLMEQHEGELLSFLVELGSFDTTGLVQSWQEAVALMDQGAPLLLAHGNYLKEQDAAWLGQATVVYCPRTHAFFGHPAHPLPLLHKQGVRMALGTDSLASNPDLDLWQEMQCVWSKRSEWRLTGADVLRFGTLAGAIALGWADAIGSLTVGKRADFIVRPMKKTTGTNDDPHSLLFQAAGTVQAVFIDGELLGTLNHS